MKRKWKRIIVGSIFIFGLGLSATAPASYFPGPTPTDHWDWLCGTIDGQGITFNTGDELAGYDASGTIRMLATVWTAPNTYSWANFYDPSPNSKDTSTFTWKLYDASEGIVYLATADDLSGWQNWVGTPEWKQINFTRGGSEGTIPEPMTIIILGGVLVSGLFVRRVSKGKEKSE